MNIRFILNQPYPHGMACTNRVHNYAKGLSELGHQIEIIIPIPLEQEAEAKNHQAVGQHEGVSYRYMGNTPYRSENFLRRRIGDIIQPLMAARHLSVSPIRTNAILLVSNSLFHILLFKAVAIYAGAVYIQEKSELPFAFSRRKGALTNLYRKIYNRLVYRIFDGVIVISEQLRVFFEPLLKRSADQLLVPIIVNLEEFNASKEFMSSEKYIAYAGNLSDHKDGISTLLEAFRQVTLEHPDARLYLIGKPAPDAQQKVDTFIAKHRLQSRVVVTGYVSREDLVAYLKGASALALAKPQSVQADFCFPSKLGEYLATKKPVVTTKVGEIPDYLEDEKTAYLTPPDDPSAFANKLAWVLSHPEEAEQVGRQGNKIANEQFSYQKQGQRIADFIQARVAKASR